MTRMISLTAIAALAPESIATGGLPAAQAEALRNARPDPRGGGVVDDTAGGDAAAAAPARRRFGKSKPISVGALVGPESAKALEEQTGGALVASLPKGDDPIVSDAEATAIVTAIEEQLPAVAAEAWARHPNNPANKIADGAKANTSERKVVGNGGRKVRDGIADSMAKVDSVRRPRKAKAQDDTTPDKGGDVDKLARPGKGGKTSLPKDKGADKPADKPADETISVAGVDNPVTVPRRTGEDEGRYQRRVAGAREAGKDGFANETMHHEAQRYRAAREAERAAVSGNSPIQQAASKRAQVQAEAEAGILPQAPDFSAETHKRYRGKLDQLCKMIEAGDLKGLESMPIPTYDSSVKALDKFRNLAVTALKAQRAAAKQQKGG